MPIAFATAASTIAVSSAVSLTINTANVGDVILVEGFKNNVSTGFATLAVNSTGVTRTHKSTAIGGGTVEAGWIVPSASGAQTVSALVTGAAAQSFFLSAAVYSGVDSTTPIGSTGAASAAAGTSGAATVAVPSSVGHITVAAITIASTFTGASGALTSGTGVTLREKFYSSGGTSGALVAWGEVNSSGTASTVTFLVSSAATSGWMIAGWTLQPAGAAAAARAHRIAGWF